MSHSLSCIFHTHHTSCSHFQTPPHLSNASLLWVFLQRADPPPEAPGSHVCHQIYQQSIPSEGRNSCPGGHHLTPRDACQRVHKLGFPEESGNEMCHSGHTRTLHLESSSESTLISRACNGDATAGLVERALTYKSGALDSAPGVSLVSHCE